MVDYDSSDMEVLLRAEEHAVSCVLPLGHWIFFKLFWISMIVYIRQTGWSDQAMTYNGKTLSSQKWLWSFVKGGHLWEVPTM